MDDPVLSMRQVAAALRCCARTADKLVDTGRLDGYRLPGSLHRRVLRSRLVQFMEAAGLPPEWIDQARQLQREPSGRRRFAETSGRKAEAVL